MSRMLWKTEKSSTVHRTESVSMIHHGQSVVVSSTAADQIQRNFFYRILSVWFVELPGRRALQSGGDIGCRLLRWERTSQPDMMELLDGGTCRPVNWTYTPPAAENILTSLQTFRILLSNGEMPSYHITNVVWRNLYTPLKENISSQCYVYTIFWMQPSLHGAFVMFVLTPLTTTHKGL